jgi:hypothetical protein
MPNCRQRRRQVAAHGTRTSINENTLRLRFVVAVQVNILAFCSLLTAGNDREELDPKFLFVELNKSIHNQFPGGGVGCLKWLAPRSWKASEIGCKEDDKPTMTVSKYQS